jgi:single-strand DNA-binding protein
MINSVVLTGRLANDPDLRTTQSGTQSAKFSLAVNRKNKQPNQPDADFINCVAFGKTAETIAQYLHKGSLIGVEGRLQTGKYDNQIGQTVYFTNVLVNSFTFLESRKDSQQQPAYQNPYSQPTVQPNNPYQQQPQQAKKSSYSQGQMNFQNGNTSLGDFDNGFGNEDYSDLPF